MRKSRSIFFGAIIGILAGATSLTYSVSEVSFASTPEEELAVAVYTVSDAITPDEVVSITGHNVYTSSTVVEGTSYSNHQKYTFSIIDGDDVNGEFVNCSMPYGAPNGLYDIQVKNNDGASNVVIMNAPRINWISECTIHSGVTIYCTGRNMDGSEYGMSSLTPKVRLYSTTDSTAYYDATIVSYDKYLVEIGVSDSVPTGEYNVKISIGDYDVWSQCETQQTLTVVEKKTSVLNSTNYKTYAPQANVAWEQDFVWSRVVDITSYSPAVGDTSNLATAASYGKTNITAFNNAVNYLINQGGGVIYIPNGDYIIGGTIWMYSNILFVGESEDGVRLHFINGDYNGKSCAYYNNGFRVKNDRTVEYYGLYRMTIDAYEMEDGACPDMFINFGSNYLWQYCIVKNVTVNGPDQYYVCDKGHNHRGIAFNFSCSDTAAGYNGRKFDGGHLVLTECTSHSVQGAPLQFYLGAYLKMTNNNWWYLRGCTSITTPYSIVMNNVYDTNGDVDQSYLSSTDVHGIMHRGYAYFESNEIYDDYDSSAMSNNVGEAICAEICVSYSYGAVLSATKTSVTVAVAGPMQSLNVVQGRLTVAIVSGKGSGQMIEVDPQDIVVTDESAYIPLQSEWLITPDATSVYTLQEACEAVTYYRNYVNGSTKGLLLYCNYRDAVVSENELKNCGGVGIFAVRRPQGSNIEVGDTWYYNYGTTQDENNNITGYYSQELRYNTNARIRIEGNDISGVSPCTHICGIRLRGEQRYNDTYAGLVQNTNVEIRHNTIKAGGYWGYTKDGVDTYINKDIPQSQWKWVADDQDRISMGCDEVATYINSANHQVSGIMVGNYNTAGFTEDATNRNILVEDNVVTGATSGLLVAILSRDIIVIGNDFTDCSVDIEVDERSGNTNQHTNSDILVFSDITSVRLNYNGSFSTSTTATTIGPVDIQIMTYIVTYLLDGNSYTSQTYKYGDTIVAPSVSAVAGSKFSGWIGLPTTMPRQSITISGRYVSDSETFTLSYRVNSQVVNSVSYHFGDAIVSYIGPSVEGYTFSKWIDIPATMPASDLTVDGEYTINSYTLSYKYIIKVNGVATTYTYTTRSVKYNSVIKIASVTMSVTGYDFVGWDTTLAGTLVKGNTDIFANLTPHTHKVTFYINGEAYHTQNVQYGEEVVEPTYVEENGEGMPDWDTPAYMGDYDVDVEATLHIYYTITYKVDGAVYTTRQCEKNATVTAILSKPKKSGYTFISWTGLPTTMPNHDIEVTAYFITSDQDFTLTYKVDGEVYSTQTYKYCNAITSVTAPSKTGYTFVEWEDLPTTMPASDLVVNAVYEKNTYRVTYMYTFKMYNGTTKTNTKRIDTYQYGDTFTCASDTLNITGYDFEGWSGLSNGDIVVEDTIINAVLTQHTHNVIFNIDGEYYTTVAFGYGDLIVPPTYDSASDNRYPIWDTTSHKYMLEQDFTLDATVKIMYTIKFMSSSSTIFATMLVEEGEEIVAPVTNPTKKGYTFTQWFGYTEGTTATNNVTYYAKYTESAEEDTNGCMGAIAMLSAFMGIISLAIIGKKY